MDAAENATIAAMHAVHAVHAVTAAVTEIDAAENAKITAVHAVTAVTAAVNREKAMISRPKITSLIRCNFTISLGHRCRVHVTTQRWIALNEGHTCMHSLPVKQTPGCEES